MTTRKKVDPEEVPEEEQHSESAASLDTPDEPDWEAMLQNDAAKGEVIEADSLKADAAKGEAEEFEDDEEDEQGYTIWDHIIRRMEK